MRVEEWMDSHTYCPDLMGLLILEMKNWKQKAPIEIEGEYSFDIIDRVIICQNEVGWRLFWDIYLSH